MIKLSHTLIAIIFLSAGIYIGKYWHNTHDLVVKFLSCKHELETAKDDIHRNYFDPYWKIKTSEYQGKMMNTKAVLLLAKHDLEDCKYKKKCVIECGPCKCPPMWTDSAP